MHEDFLHDFLNFILAIVILITAAKAGGYLSTRIGQPSVLGELLVGLLLGPTVLDILHAWPVLAGSENLANYIKLIAELGVMLLMLLAGLELHLEELLQSGRVAAVAGTLGVIVPLGLGWGISSLFGLGPAEALFMGLALSATSVSISAQTLMEMNVLRSRVGLALLGAAVFDDILVILALSIAFLAVGGVAGGFGAIAITVLQMVAYLAGAAVIGFWILPWVVRQIDRLPISQGIVAFTLVAALFFGWAAQVWGGMAAITGAFLVGLFLARTPFRDEMQRGISAIAYGFFVPVFFVNIGLEVNMRELGGDTLWFAIVITVVAVLTKIIGSGGGALLTGMSGREALQLGIGMVSRGEVGLIVAAAALTEGYLTGTDFSVAVFMVIIATLVTPPLLRAAFAGSRPEAGRSA